MQKVPDFIDIQVYTSCSSKMGWYFSRESFLSIPESSSAKKDNEKGKNNNTDTLHLENTWTPSLICAHFSVTDLWVELQLAKSHRLQVSELPSSDFATEVPYFFIWALSEPLKEIQRLVPKPPQHCLDCTLQFIVMLKG